MPETAATEALAPFTRLAELVRAQATKVGLKMVGMAVIPPVDGNPPLLRFAVVLDEDAKPSGDPEADELLAGILMATEEDERAARRTQQEETVSEITDLLKKPGAGFLDD